MFTLVALVLLGAMPPIFQTPAGRPAEKIQYYNLDGSKAEAPEDLTIPEAVARYGKAELALFSESVSLTLPDLVSQCEVAIKGLVLSKRSYLSANHRAIFTDFEIRILDAYKSSRRVRQIDKILVTVLGGKLDLPGGEATFRTDSRESMMPGQTYILFLAPTARKEKESAYTLVGGSQGAFRLVGERVVPMAEGSRQSFKEFLGADESDFTTDILRAARGRK